jgi:long-chain acyl-CoA synthetase
MNIAHHIERAAKFFPEKPAIIFEGAELQYGDLNLRVNRLANALKANGVARGDRVALYLPNIPQFVVCYCAVLKAGAIAVSVSSAFKGEEVQYILNDSGAKILFTTSELLPNVLRSECPSLAQVVVCFGDPQGNASLDDWLSQGASDARAEDMSPADPALLLYTSGTTGFPKGATLSHGNVVSNMYSTVHHCGYRPGDRMAAFLPLFHVFGQNFIMNATFNACATLMLYRRFTPDGVLGSIQRDRVSMFFAVPTIYINLLNMDLSKYELS